MKKHVCGLITSIVAATSLAGFAQPNLCQHVQVLNRCEGGIVAMYQLGSTSPHAWWMMGSGGSHTLGGVAFSTVPGHSHRESFVTQGRYLRVVDSRNERYNLLDIEAIAALPGFRMSGVAAASPVDVLTPFGPQPQYALFLVGNAAEVPSWVVLDQVVALDPAATSGWLLGKGDFCRGRPDCNGSAVGVAVGASTSSAGSQQAFASLLWRFNNGTQRQRYYRISRGPYPYGPFSVSFSVTNEGANWSATQHRFLGVDYDALGQTAAGAFQTEGKIGDLGGGAKSCVLPGAPTDVALWGPAAGFATQRIQFVSYDTPGTGGALAASPFLTCAGSSGPPSMIDATADNPVALALSTRQSPDFWVYSAGSGEWVVRGAKLLLQQQPGGPETLSLQESLQILAACSGQYDAEPGCIVDVAISELAPMDDPCPPPPDPHATCPDFPQVDLPCCLDPADLDPHCRQCPVSGPPQLIIPFGPPRP